MADKTKSVIVRGEAEVDTLKVAQEIRDLKAEVAELKQAIEDAKAAAQAAADSAARAAEEAQAAATRSVKGARKASKSRAASTDDEVLAAEVAAAGGPPSIPSDTLLTVALASWFHSKLGHTHTNMPTTAQKKALDLANVSDTNRVAGMADLVEASRLTDKFPVGYKRFNSITAPGTPYIDVSTPLAGEAISGSLVQEGLVSGLRTHIRQHDTQLAITFDNFAVYGRLRVELVVLLRRPPQSNIALLSVALGANVTSYIIDKPNLLLKSDSVIVPSTNLATIQTLKDLNRGGYFVNPEDSVPEDLPAGHKVYKLIAGEIFIKERVLGEWATGDTGGLAVTRQSVHALVPGNQVYLNPGQVNEELKTILSITPSGPGDRDPIDIRFTTGLAYDHDGGEPVCRSDIVEIANSRTDLFLDLYSLNTSGVEVPQTISGKVIDILIPYRFRNKNLPNDLLQAVTEFLHLAEGVGGAPANPVQAISTGYFGALNQPVVHNLSLSAYGVYTEQILDMNSDTIGNRGVGEILLNSFRVTNTGGGTSGSFDWMITSLTPTNPLMATGVAVFSVGEQATLVQHNLGLSQYFVAIELLTDAGLASVGALGVDNIGSNSFEVRHTGANSTSSFRWTVFTTELLPQRCLVAAGVGTFPGNGTDLTITHNADRSTYLFKITPIYGAALASVGTYGVHSKTLNTIKVTNNGQDNTTQFAWALFVPPDD